MGRGRFEKKADSENDQNTVAGGEPAEKSKKKINVTRLLLKILIVLLAILLVLMIVAAVALHYVFGRIGRYDDQQPSGPTEPVVQIFETDATVEGEETYESVAPEDVVWGSVETMNSKHVINILLIGNDARSGESRARSDTIILVSLNENTKEIQLTSFMRDLYVQIPGYQDDRINAAYALGGPELLDATLEKNFGVKVDGNVEINFEAFEKVIDILGGVDVEITGAEANFLISNHGIYVSEGMNHLNGPDALWFARIRKFGNGDYGRTERQRRLITAVVNSLKDSSITDIIALINEVLPYVVTDLSDSEIISYASVGLEVLASGAEIGSVRIPEDDAHYGASIRGMSVLVPNLPMCQEDLKEFLSDEG